MSADLRQTAANTTLTKIKTAILDTAKAALSRPFPARFDGRCAITGARFYAGEQIRMVEGEAVLPRSLSAVTDAGGWCNAMTADADAAVAAIREGAPRVIFVDNRGQLRRLSAWPSGTLVLNGKVCTPRQLAARTKKCPIMVVHGVVARAA